MAVSFDLLRAVRQVLSYDTERIGNPRDLLVYLMDLLDYGDFRIIEQAASFGADEHTNLIGLRGPATRGGLLLCSSVVNWGRSPSWLWTETEEDPHNPTERDGLLFATGATSGKVDLVCKILAASNVEPEALKRPVTVAGLFGDDARVGGAMYLLDSGICMPEWALVGEATDLSLIAAHRGYLVLRFDLMLGEPSRSSKPAKERGRVFRVEVDGRSAHSAMPSLGRNAVEHAFQLIARLHAGQVPFTTHMMLGEGTPDSIPGDCTFYIRTEAPDWVPYGRHLLVEELDEDLELGPPIDDAVETWIGIIAQLHELFRWSAPDTAPDFVPATSVYSVMEAGSGLDSLQVWLEYRTLPGQHTEDLIRDVDSLARRSPGVPASVSVERNLLPFDGQLDSHLARSSRHALQSLSLPPVLGTYPGCAEAWVFESAGVDTLCFGPGNVLANRFRPNEHVLLRQLEYATAFYEQVIRRMCG